MQEEEEEEEEEEELEEDANDRMRNEINDVYDNDTNKLAAVMVSGWQVLLPSLGGQLLKLFSMCCCKTNRSCRKDSCVCMG